MPAKLYSSRARCMLMFLLLLAAVPAWSAEYDCGKLKNAYGPFDYTNPVHRRDNIPIVTNAHFTRSVRALEQGPSGRVGQDIDYTLRAIPNHHEALYAMARWEFKTQKNPPPGSRYTVDCWFDRAIRFKPDDGVVRLVYGIYLQRKDELDLAEQRYQEALEMIPDSAELHYNMGLLYADTKRYALAREHARKAYDAGYPLTGLRRKLERAGAWEESDS